MKSLNTWGLGTAKWQKSLPQVPSVTLHSVSRRSVVLVATVTKLGFTLSMSVEGNGREGVSSTNNLPAPTSSQCNPNHHPYLPKEDRAETHAAGHEQHEQRYLLTQHFPAHLQDKPLRWAARTSWPQQNTSVCRMLPWVWPDTGLEQEPFFHFSVIVRIAIPA